MYEIAILFMFEQVSRLMGKPTICIGENKDADQLRGNREADQRLCFRYPDSTIPPLLNSKISCFQPASVTVQLGLCRTCSETTLLVFPRGGSNRATMLVHVFHNVCEALDIIQTLSRLVGKPTMWFLNRSDINRPVQSQKMARGWKFWIYKEEEMYYPCCENKGADQLRSYCEADLRLCFRICRLLVFP